MTGVDADLATLRDLLLTPPGRVGVTQGQDAYEALARVEAELSRLREQRDALRADYGDALKEVDELLDLMDAGREHIEPHDPIAPFLSAGWQCPVCDRRGNLHDERCLVLEIAAVARRRKNGNRRLVVTNGRLRARAEAAEARCARLQQALAGLESAVRILDVMLREPAAEGLMSAEDYRSYVQGAWLGVDEAAEKAREALAGPDAQTSGSGSSAADPSVGERQGRQPDPGEIAGLLVELSRWSRVAELNGDLHARIASALAGPDTLTAGEPGVGPDGTVAGYAPADGCAERQSTADPSPAASAGPDTPADPDAPFDYLDCYCDGEEGCAYCTPADSQEDNQ